MKRFIFSEELIFRYPVFAEYETVFNHSDRQKLKENPEFLDRLYLASEVFCNRLNHEENNQKIELTLSKYMNRASNRSTPFGGFAGNAISKWELSSTYNSTSDHFHCKLDSGLLGHIISKIEDVEVVKEQLIYFKNPTVYTVGDKLRFYDYKGSGSRNYFLSSIDHDLGVEFVLSNCNHMVYIDMVNSLRKEFDASFEEGKKFIDSLIQNTLLFSELQMNVVGIDGLEKLIQSLNRIKSNTNIESILNPLIEIQSILSSDFLSMSVKIKSVKDLLLKSGFYIELEDYIQVDTYRESCDHDVSPKVQSELLKAVGFLDKITPRVANPNLEAFRKKFYEKFENQEIPLLVALDPENGIGYGQNTELGSSLSIENGLGLEIGIGKRNFQEFKILHFNVILAKKIVEVGNSKEINLEELDIDFDYSNQAMPPTFSILFRRLPEGKLLLENTGWATAASMLGRFGNGDKSIHKLLTEIAQKDNEGFDSAIVAEISHLPETRFGNVANRPQNRDYVIPIISGYEKSEKVIDLDRINVVIVNDRLMLRSVDLNKWIIPRVSTAHNFSQNTLPVYQFLGDLQNDYHKYWLGIQTDDLRRLGFVRIPRLRIGNVVLQLEKWKFGKKELHDLLVRDFENFKQKWTEFREAWQIPSVIILSDNDNELIINSFIDEDLFVLFDEMRKKGRVELKEFYVSEKQELNNYWKNQYLGIVNSVEKITLPKLPIVENQTQIKRMFSLGSEWLFVKIYAGYNALEEIISKHIKELIDELTSEDIVDQFFFIRYEDPGKHVRLRIKLKDKKQLNIVLEKINERFSSLIETRFIDSLKFDTYCREIERYGSEGIELSEELFYRDSQSVINFFDSQIHASVSVDKRWLFCMRSIDSLLDDFGFNLEDKYQQLDFMSNSFYDEFQVNSRQKKLISDKYRFSKKDISEYLEMELPIYLLDRSIALKKTVNEISKRIETGLINDSVENLIFSYIHMLVNRIFSKNHRRQELVIYDFLRVYYKSKLMRKFHQKTA